MAAMSSTSRLGYCNLVVITIALKTSNTSLTLEFVNKKSNILLGTHSIDHQTTSKTTIKLNQHLPKLFQQPFEITLIKRLYCGADVLNCIIFSWIKLINELNETSELLNTSLQFTCIEVSPNIRTMLQLTLTCDGAMDLGAILQFNGNRLMAEFHQKPASIQHNYT